MSKQVCEVCLRPAGAGDGVKMKNFRGLSSDLDLCNACVAEIVRTAREVWLLSVASGYGQDSTTMQALGVALGEAANSVVGKHVREKNPER